MIKQVTQYLLDNRKKMKLKQQKKLTSRYDVIVLHFLTLNLQETLFSSSVKRHSSSFNL